MRELSFESTQSMGQSEFAGWVEKRAHWDDNRYELLNGRVVMTPQASHPHGWIEGQLLRLIGNHAADHRLGEVFGSSQGFELPSGDTVEPHVSFVSGERWSQTTASPGRFLEVVPDLVVEIASESTASRDRGKKKAIYERNGVREYWLVDWRSREVTVFHLVGGRFDEGTVTGPGGRALSSVLAGFEVSVGDLLAH
ncbi:MAG: Uma2 family endonuclease [Myxococcales bacterium]|jgi:Uma2 family endonuclease